MSISVQEELTDAIFRTPLEPEAWGDVMGLMAQRFPSSAQTFYFLNRCERRVRPVALRGVTPHWRSVFDDLYFRDDNPWMRLTNRLHRPGIVRTNERLEQVLGEPGVLYGSSYYNEWMRPQGFKYTIGNTLLADDDIVANITLLRSPDLPTFDAAEVAEFEALSRRMTLVLRIAMQLERAQGGAGYTRAFDALPQPVALVDAQCRIGYANRAMESMLRARRGLLSHQGVLQATLPEAQDALRACVAAALTAGPGAEASSTSIAGGLLLAIPGAGAIGRYLPASPRRVLLMLTTPGTRGPSGEDLQAAYGFTRAESNLAAWLIKGRSLHQAASAMGITYGSARVYLKALFEKSNVHSQGQFVAKMLGQRQISPDG